MGYRGGVAAWLLALLFGLYCAPAGASPAGRALIICDSVGQSPDLPRATALTLAQYLGHFPISADILSMRDYQAGALRGYRWVLVAATRPDAVIPNSLLADVRACRRPVLWLDRGVGSLGAGFLARAGLRYVGLADKPGFSQVRYRGVLLPKADPHTCVVQVTDPSRCRVLAEAVSDGRTAPYITRSGRFWYVADNPFVGITRMDRSLALTDVLHDFLGIAHPASRRALIRIEDVAPGADAQGLRDIADRLSAVGAPFMVALIPRYVNPQAHAQQDLPQCRPLVDALRYVDAHGGSIVMHGFTHNYHGVSAADCEFWDADTNRPIKEDSARYVRERLSSGVRLCLDAGITPLAWETPHYVASAVDFREIVRCFSTCVEQRILMNEFSFGRAFPFVIERDIYGQRIVPENLGYVPFQAGANGGDDPAKEEDDVRDILDSAARARVLRDASVGVFFHPFLSHSLLSDLAAGLKKLGYSFINLREQSNRVEVDDMLVATGEASGQVRLHDQYLQEYFVSPAGAVTHERISARRMTGIVRRHVSCRPGWTYVARGISLRR